MLPELLTSPPAAMLSLMVAPLLSTPQNRISSCGLPWPGSAINRQDYNEPSATLMHRFSAVVAWSDRFVQGPTLVKSGGLCGCDGVVVYGCVEGVVCLAAYVVVGVVE